ncbi:SagB/ThcOx family dehydrogenase [Actinomadura sp. DC4]|uniref:SagB/ThcOx family dehydrogenase n=1 Tax=Actinomadura sp. DC4 TaxID=3055069 RepID=UPI0025AEDDC8|nr:SagB/ThcOx family dehydrogenase [Actinomadura sp. DC4]MDN3354452.1 SagB/ThcOx family dehydrogenase [Actinomadura sp. DC4]
MIPPSELVGDRWIAENLLEKKRYNLQVPAAAALTAAFRPRTPDDLAGRLADHDPQRRPAAYWSGLVEVLRDRALIVEASRAAGDPRLGWLAGLRESWSRYGWAEAAEYHTLAYDYPCVDYSEAAGTYFDHDRMRAYQAVEPDTDRYKLDYADRPGLPLPPPGEEMAPGTVRTVWGDERLRSRVDVEALSRVLSLSFGATGVRVPITDAAPLLRRSSPSGGGRNPSEGYVVVRDVAGVEAGRYHVTMQPFGLRRLEDGGPIDDEQIRRIFPETSRRFSGDVRALVVITSFFERNMYRYREPRTFRTVHMDAGHIASTLSMSARALGLSAGVYDRDAAADVEQALGIRGMREGYLLTVAIADGAEPAEHAQGERP